jgi:hypothetical protein
VIGFGICVGDSERFARCAVPGLGACAEADSAIAESTGNSSIFAAYNEMLDAFAGEPRLEALVLMHEDVELTDSRFCSKLRRTLSDPTVAVAGVVGARNVTSLKWWDGEGFGRVAESRGVVDFGPRQADVDAVDGLLLALSPWAVRNLRFDDQRFHGFHGYDIDFCFQARAAGRRVVVTDLDVVHHTRGGYGDLEAFMQADTTFRSKWAIAPLESAAS